MKRRGANYIHTWKSRGDGQFDIGTFAGPAGYAVGAGQWIAADFNGDGKVDLIHAVHGTNYIHTWKSRGDGQFDIGTFAGPAGYAVGAGQWLAADFNGDGKVDLVHAVRGTNYVHPWRSRGDGTFDISTFRGWTGYPVGFPMWVAADFNGDKKVDLIHAVSGTNYIHTWRVTAP